MLLNEKMEVDLMCNTKVNEVAYLSKYLEEYEKEIKVLKSQFEAQIKKIT